jgi:hypothetical protein
MYLGMMMVSLEDMSIKKLSRIHGTIFAPSQTNLFYILHPIIVGTDNRLLT